MSLETFRFSTSWQERDPEGVTRDYGRMFSFDVYATGLDQHVKACRGDWITPEMAFPQVSELAGVSGGKRRVIREALNLWVDDRPPMTRDEFRRFRQEMFGVIEKRSDEVAGRRAA